MRYVKTDSRTLPDPWGAPLEGARDMVAASIWCPETAQLAAYVLSVCAGAGMVSVLSSSWAARVALQRPCSLESWPTWRREGAAGGSARTNTWTHIRAHEGHGNDAPIALSNGSNVHGSSSPGAVPGTTTWETHCYDTSLEALSPRKACNDLQRARTFG